MKKLVIFDLDGTLFNTTVAMRDCGNYALEKIGLPLLTAEDYARFSGADVEGFIKAILYAAGDEKAEHYDTFWHLYKEKNLLLADSANIPYPGIPSLLSLLQEKGVGLAVLSNKDHETCVRIVEGAFGKGTFDVIFGGRENIPAKPDPAGAVELMQKLSLSPEDCLYVGDTEVDMKTGKNAGIDTVAVLWGYRTREILSSYNPEYMITKPEEILSLV